MRWKDEVLLVGTILYIGINIAFFVPIVHVTLRQIKAYRKVDKKPNRLLFAVSLLFNVVTAASVFGLLFMTCLKLQAIETQSDLHDNLLWRRYHGIFVLFYGKQNALMLLVLYLRVYYIFYGTRMQFSKLTFWFFNAAFAMAILVFTSLPIIHSQWTYLSIWTICASSFCVYNVTFMTALSYLFASKLLSSFKGIRGSGNRKGRQSVVNMMTKTCLLAMFSISMTMASCVLLILRYSVHYESKAVYVMSNWLMSFDIYSNFIFVSLTMAYFDKYYRVVFGRIDALFKRFLYWVVTRGDVDSMRLAEYFEQHEKEVNGGGDSRNRSATASAVAHATSTRDIGNIDGDGDGAGGKDTASVPAADCAECTECELDGDHRKSGDLGSMETVCGPKESNITISTPETVPTHSADGSVDSVPSKQPQCGAFPVPSSSVNTESGTATAAAAAAVAETNGQPEVKRASANRIAPVYEHQSSTTMSSTMASEEPKDQTPSTCTHSRSEDLV